MKTQLARIQQVLSGHSARALVHAVDADGLEYKIEVPADAARGLSSGHVLWIAWSAHAMPAPTADAPRVETAPAAAVSGSNVSAVQSADEQFSAMMARRQPAETTAASLPATTTGSGRSAPQDLATLLGVR